MKKESSEVKKVDVTEELKNLIEVKKEKLSDVEKYQKFITEREELNKKNGAYLFQNINLGEERGKAESEIKLLQSKIDALKATEAYLDTLLEETQKKITFIDTSIRQLERTKDVKDFLNEKNS